MSVLLLLSQVQVVGFFLPVGLYWWLVLELLAWHGLHWMCVGMSGFVSGMVGWIYLIFPSSTLAVDSTILN